MQFHYITFLLLSKSLLSTFLNFSPVQGVSRSICNRKDSLDREDHFFLSFYLERKTIKTFQLETARKTIGISYSGCVL